MIQITKDNYKDTKFDGIIAYKRNNPRPDGAFNGIGMIVEDAYYANNTSYKRRGRGYDGYGCEQCISFHLKNDAYLPNGAFLNSTSRQHHLEDILERCLDSGEPRYSVYKFENVVEFAEWVIENRELYEIEWEDFQQCFERQYLENNKLETCDYYDVNKLPRSIICNEMSYNLESLKFGNPTEDQVKATYIAKKDKQIIYAKEQ